MFLKPNIAFYLLLITGLCVSDVSTCFARSATQDDSASKYENFRQDIYIKKNGNFSLLTESKIKILKENAKATFASYTLPYDARLQKIKILEASSFFKNKQFTVPNNKIKDQALSSEKNHLSEHREIVIPFLKVEKNSIISLKKLISSDAILPHFFSQYFTFGDSYTEKATISIISELPLYTKVRDPKKLLGITQYTKQYKQKKLYYLSIHLKKPIYKAIADENSYHLNPKHIPVVFVSATEELPYFKAVCAQTYTKIKNQPLPDLYQEIANIANTKNTTIEKINTITSLLAEKLNYLSISNTSSHGYFPQSLQTVVDHRLGDCKDFATATSAILQSIGISSKIVRIASQEPLLRFTCDLPGHHGSDHIILKVELPEGPLWIDPTAPISMPNYRLPYMSNKKVMVLGEKTSSYETIPSIKPSDYHIIKHEIWTMDNEVSNIKGNLQLKGIAAYPLTGLGNHLSQQSIKDVFISIIDKKQGQILKSDVTLPDLHSRVVKDLSFDYDMAVKNPILKTNAGLAIAIPFRALELFSVKPNTVSDLYLESPKIIESYIEIKNIKPIGKDNLECAIESPWVNIWKIVS